MEPAKETNLKTTLKLTTIDKVGGILCNVCNTTFGNKKNFEAHYKTHISGPETIFYTCVVCQKEFNNYASFRGHCYTHHVLKSKLRCKHCNKEFSKSSVLTEHISRKHEFKCNTCFKEFSSKPELSLHTITHLNVKSTFMCKSCNQTLLSVEDCECHFDQHLESTYPCPVCDEEFNNQEKVLKHIQVHFGKVLTQDFIEEINEIMPPEDTCIDLAGGIFCSQCGALHKNKSEFLSHFTDDHPGQPVMYTCNICGKEHEDYYQFWDDCYGHVTKNKHQCDHCDKSFNRLYHLIVHMEAFHSGEPLEKPFACVHCPQRFATERRFREHLRDIHKTTNMYCSAPGCGKKFEIVKDLLIHEREHSTHTDAFCRLCQLRLPTVEACAKHIFVHKTNIYSCSICEVKYNEKFLLVKHFPKHFETSMHFCKICGKVYSIKSRLVEHMKTHSNVATHKCFDCGKGYVNLMQLRQHMNVHTGGKNYNCGKCDKSFANYSNYSKHLQRTHNMKPKRMANNISLGNNNNENVIIQEIPNDSELNMDTESEKQIRNPQVDGPSDIMDDYLMTKVNDDLVRDNTSVETSMNECASVHNEEIVEYNNNEAKTDNIDLNTVVEIIDALEAEANEKTTFVKDTATASQLPSTHLSEITRYPCEYGPDFIHKVVDIPDCNGHYIDLDDQILPHIDPLLTIKNQTNETFLSNNFVSYGQEFLQSDDFVSYQQDFIGTGPVWEPPVITKYYEEYNMSYQDVK